MQSEIYSYICAFCKTQSDFPIKLDSVRCWRCKNQALPRKTIYGNGSDKQRCFRCGDGIPEFNGSTFKKLITLCQGCTKAVLHQKYIALSWAERNIEGQRWPVVYFLQPVEGGNIKIGFTDTFYKRFNQIQAHSPLILNVVLMLEGNKQEEEALHARFRQYRQHYEWFDAHPEILDFVDIHNNLSRRDELNLKLIKSTRHPEKARATRFGD